MPRPYTLLAAVGMSPAVLTETVWSLAQDGLLPEAVHVLTTSVGQERFETSLLSGGTTSRWSRLCREVIKCEPTLHFTVPHRGGVPLDDIRSRADDLAFGDACYALVRRLAEPPKAAPLVGSIAGGRKTMSAHVLAAFSLYARPQDRLVHVLATPDPMPGQPTPFWPGDGEGPLTIERVDVPFARVRAVLAEHFVERLGDRYDLPSVLQVLEQYNVRDVPARVRVWLTGERRARSQVELLASDGRVLAKGGFTRRMLGLFLLLADEIEEMRRTSGGPSGVVAHTLTGTDGTPEAPLARPHTARRISAVYAWCGFMHEPEPVWEPSEVRTKISRYHNTEGLGAVSIPPLFQKHLAFDRTKGHELARDPSLSILEPDAWYWHWPGFHALPISVVAPPGLSPDAHPWPFRTISPPIRYKETA
ncbi:MAG: CRISPR-associated ring nuclease Csm6 [Bacteroidota bacterium]